MLIIYGSMLCPDCVACREALDKVGIRYDYRDFADSLVNLKEFLKIRDENPIFAELKAAGRIGIPCILRQDGSVLLDWEELIP